MADRAIGLYSNAYQLENPALIDVPMFLDNIRSGKWQDIVIPIRTIKDKKERAAAKVKAPLVTISGNFKSRKDEDIIQHSGFIAIDIDDVDIINTKRRLFGDPYVYAMFQSISGRGLCVIFSIVPSKHREAFMGISEYLFRVYRLVVDPTSINPSRARFVSFDPDLYEVDDYQKFIDYPKDKPPRKVEQVVFSDDDFGEMLNQIRDRNINLCENYYEWLRIGFAFAHQFGEGGRSYFHAVSSASSKYDDRLCDKQYNACLKHEGKGSNVVTISTFYHYAKLAGIRNYSDKTKKVAYTAQQGKKAGLSPVQVAKNLEKFEGITGADQMIQQAFELPAFNGDDDGLLPQMENWLSQNYILRRNEITRYIERHPEGISMEQRHLNTIFISMKKILTEVTYDLMDRVINSEFIKDFNPITKFIEDNKHRNPSGCIDALAATISGTDTRFVKHFFKKWMVGVISSIMGDHSPLMFVLVGERQGCGKTEFFRRLLPKELKKYYAESKLDAGKDDEILMTQKLIIMDDEMGGKSKKEHRRLKELTSKQTFSLREPYGRGNVDLNRIASLAGTSNDKEIISDPTGNRRIICVNVDSIDHDMYNAIDKTDLMMEAYWLWKNGFKWRLGKEDIAMLDATRENFEVITAENDLIQKHFLPAGSQEPGGEQMTSTDIQVYLERATGIRINRASVGAAMRILGYKESRIRGNGSRGWEVVKANFSERPPIPF